jgi:phage gpG-like protein
MDVSFHLFGDFEFHHQLEQIADHADNMSPAFEAIRDRWTSVLEEQFETQGVRSGAKWEELQFVTIAKRGSAEPILIDSSDLLLRVTDPGSFRIDDDGIVYDPEGVADEYGRFHQTGTRFMPQRKIADFTEADERGIINFLERYVLSTGIRRTGVRFRDAKGRFARRPT